MQSVPETRIRAANDRTVNSGGQFILYWMIAHRRTRWNFALDRAVEYARERKKPLVILEALRCGYPWASDRLHRFILQGMAANQAAIAGSNVLYYPYVEPSQGAGHGLLEALADQACVVVTDEFPCFFLPRMVAAAARRLSVLCEQVDTNGLLPLRATSESYPTAYAFRRFLQRTLSEHLDQAPRADALARAAFPHLAKLPAAITRRWPMASAKLLAGDAQELAELPIDHTVGVVETEGGAAAGEKTLRRFLSRLLPRYPEDRNEPAANATSNLSPYLHFGHISSHEIFHCLAEQENWTAELLGKKATGKRNGWWGMSEAAEAFLDQFITWRELGYNFCATRDDYDQFDSLPDWAKKTLHKHECDHRPTTYSAEEFAAANTHDDLWNAAQRQLLTEGRMHNYLRMLWGKKILEWSATPREALDTMIDLNNKYALDGRNPNSYSGIFWTLGRFDRPWGPERPIFGTVRYMSSDNTARKFDVAPYLARYGGASAEKNPANDKRTSPQPRLSKKR